MLLKWGIVSAGKISNDFAFALKALPSSDHKVVAIASRSQNSSDKFAKTHDVPKAYEGFDKLAKDENVNIVYVGNINPQHYEVAKLMLENGKHVLCEKPFTMNEKQTKRLLDIAKEKNLFVMEAIWSRCFPVYDELKKIIESGDIGDVVQITTEFGAPISHVDRLKSKELGGGVILDLGVYALQFQQFVFNGLKPTKIVTNGHLNEDGVDTSVSTIFTYPGGKMAVLTVSSLVELPCQGAVYGTKGSIKIPFFWCPTTMIVNGKTREFPLIKNDAQFYYTMSPGLAYEAEEARQCIMKGKIESPKVTHANTLELAQLMDKLRADLGVVFPADKQSY